MENGDRTGVNVVLEPQDNTGGSTISDPVDTTPVDNDSGDSNDDADTGGDSARDSECPPNCILGEDVEDASAEESAFFGAEALLAIIVIALLVAIGLITRNTEQDEEMDADQTVMIEKEWNDENKQFIPELPPLAPPPSNEEE